MSKKQAEPEPNINEVSIDRLNRSMQRAIDRELQDVGEDARRRVLAAAEDALTAMQRLAAGITVQTYDKDGEEVIYSVPPYYPAIKYLLDWMRKLTKSDPAEPSRKSGLDDETMTFLKEFLPRQEPTREPTTRDGVTILGEYTEVRSDDNDDTTSLD